MKPHIVVVDPASKVAETESFNNLVDLSPLPLTYHLPALFGADSLKTETDNIKGIVLFGSGSSVYDTLDWQDDLVRWIEPLLKSGIPSIGLCYGHQLFAKIFGGKIDFVFEDKQKHLGFREITIEKTPFWKKQTGKLTVSHREYVVACPPQMEVIAYSNEIAVDGLMHQKLPIYSLQSHPEASEAFLTHLEVPKNLIKPDSLTFGHSLMRKFLETVSGA